MGRRKARDVSGDGGGEVGLRNAQMLEELEEAFFNGPLRVCVHILTFLSIMVPREDRVVGKDNDSARSPLMAFSGSFA
jgi:hypothetical protein